MAEKMFTMLTKVTKWTTIARLGATLWATIHFLELYKVINFDKVHRFQCLGASVGAGIQCFVA